MPDEQDLDIKLEDIDGGTKSARRKLVDYKKAIEACQKGLKQNPAKGFGSREVLALSNGYPVIMSVLCIINGAVNP